MWTNAAPTLLLASASPRRLELLTQIRVPTQQLILPPQADDEPREPDETVINYVTRTATDKLARAITYWDSTNPGRPIPPVLAADTTVAIGQTILGKPVDAADARRILSELAGRSHDVYTAVTLLHHQKRYETLTHTTVEFSSDFKANLESYIATGEPFGKAGAYAIQGIAAAYVKRITGSYSGVIGLPLYETAQLLRQAGLFS